MTASLPTAPLPSSFLPPSSRPSHLPAPAAPLTFCGSIRLPNGSAVLPSPSAPLQDRAPSPPQEFLQQPFAGAIAQPVPLPSDPLLPSKSESVSASPQPSPASLAGGSQTAIAATPPLTEEAIATTTSTASAAAQSDEPANSEPVAEAAASPKPSPRTIESHSPESSDLESWTLEEIFGVAFAFLVLGSVLLWILGSPKMGFGASRGLPSDVPRPGIAPE